MKRLLKIILGVVAGCLILLFVFLILFSHTGGDQSTHKAQFEALTIRSSVILFTAQNKRCPSNMNELIETHIDKRKRTVDPWNTAYQLRCSYHPEKYDHIIVVSAGEDQKFNTEDDIIAPKPDE